MALTAQKMTAFRAVAIALMMTVACFALPDNGFARLMEEAQMTIRPPVVHNPNPQTSTMPHRDNDVKRIAAIRVEFVEDTLSTTTGSGKFTYEVDEDTLYFDPAPHDSQYFADHLKYLKFYWNTISNDNLDIEWDIYPDSLEGAYQLPRQMWQYNYNLSNEQLDYGLAELLRDAVTVADSVENSGATQGLNWNDYDLVMVFHAGAGAEFDLGYTTTPHDIPSAWMVTDDLDTLGLEEGIPVRNGAPITQGIILPETETHEGVQISMAGVITSLFGHWLELPALYDNDPEDKGASVVGKWSLMDRGFGNFYGAIPGWLDAWSRAKMGWLDPVEIEPGDYAIHANGFASDTSAEAYKIRINDHEYYLLENRNRDPENDSIAVAYDSQDRRMIFKDDYTVEKEEGFRVPVRVDNIDFDSPGSGILIWHVDEHLEAMLPIKRFNSVNERRGLDLEEADGAQDIGRDYPFLTPGYGTDYGIMADAWYRDNSFFKQANGTRPVSFTNETYPNTRSNSEAVTNISIQNFSNRDTVMTFSFSRSNKLFDFALDGRFWYPQFGVGEFLEDEYGRDEIVLLSDSIRFIDGDGAQFAVFPWVDRPIEFVSASPVIRDFNGDGFDDIVFAGLHSELGLLVYAISSADSLLGVSIKDTIPRVSNFPKALLTAAGGLGFESVLYSAVSQDGEAHLQLFGSDLERQASFTLDHEIVSMHRFGTDLSDTLLLIGSNNDLLVWRLNDINTIGTIDGVEPTDLTSLAAVADFSADGKQDAILFAQNPARMVLVKNITFDGVEEVQVIYLTQGMPLVGQIIPVDVDRDGKFEVFGMSTTGEMIAYEINGVIAENLLMTDFKFTGSDLLGQYFPERWSPLICDVSGNTYWDFLFHEGWRVREPNRHDQPAYSLASNRINLISQMGRISGGFPMEPGVARPMFRLAQLDTSPDLELLIVGSDGVTAMNPTFRGTAEDGWWMQPYRDNDHSNAVFKEFLGLGATPPDQDLLPDDLCYNWPNPASDYTAIRYYLMDQAEVKIEIYDILGNKIKTLTGNSEAGLHHEVIWNLDDVPRGAYLAVVKASSNNRSQSHKIKIAVRK